MMRHKQLKIGVLGPHGCTTQEEQWGREVGALIAAADAILVCGGLDGMMSAAAEGAKEAYGTTVGILPGDEAGEANPYIDIAIPTGMGSFRNALVVRACDAVIAIGGRYGTLSEIAFALRLEIPVVGLKTWQVARGEHVDPGIKEAEKPQEAMDLALELARKRQMWAGH